MDARLALQITHSLNNLLLEKLSSVEIGIGFDKIAEQLRCQNIKVHLSVIPYRKYEYELYFALERKNTAAFIGDFEESNRLRIRLKQVLHQKQIQDGKCKTQVLGSFILKNAIIMGNLCKSRKNKRFVIQLLQEYELII